MASMISVGTSGCALDRRWVYSRDQHSAIAADQQATWPAACSAGERQSPLDIQSRTAVPTAELTDALQVHIRKHVPLLYNSGHYFELDKTTPEHIVRKTESERAHAAAPGRGKGWSLILNQSFRFYQAHWHTPSENRIDGKEYALEAHFVHQLDDPSLVGTNERLGVIAVLYELSEACNPQLDQFWSRLPMEAGDAPFDELVDMSSWLEPLLPGGYFSWSGSLTTPPCTEGVTWNLLRQPATVCQRQVDRLKTALAGMQDGVRINNRVVQPLHGRLVRVSKSTGAGVGGALAVEAVHVEVPATGWATSMLVMVAVLLAFLLRSSPRAFTAAGCSPSEYANV